MSGAEKYCLGCGEDMDSKKIYDRRVLCSVAGEIREIWKEVMSAKLTLCELELDIEKMVGTQENPRYFCRSCFGKYKTLAKLQDELSEKAGKALMKMNPTVPPLSHMPARKRKGHPLHQQPPSKRHFSGKDQTSPSAVVRK